LLVSGDFSNSFSTSTVFRPRLVTGVRLQEALIEILVFWLRNFADKNILESNNG